MQPSSGDATSISFYSGEVDTFEKGALLFSDRKYTVAECPEWLKGKQFLRNSINTERFNIEKDGILTLITPTICDSKISASRATYLEKRRVLNALTNLRNSSSSAKRSGTSPVSTRSR